MGDVGDLGYSMPFKMLGCLGGPAQVNCLCQGGVLICGTHVSVLGCVLELCMYVHGSS